MLAYIYFAEDKDPYQLVQLKHHLEGLQRQKVISGLKGYRIMQNLRTRIAIDDSAEYDAILLFVSQKFINSPYCKNGEEIKKILEFCRSKEVPLIPVILDGADRTSTPFSDVDKVSEEGSVMFLRNKLGSFNEAYRKVAQEIKNKILDRSIRQKESRISQLSEETSFLRDANRALETEKNYLETSNKRLDEEKNYYLSQFQPIFDQNRVLIENNEKAGREIGELRRGIARLDANAASLLSQNKQITAENNRLAIRNKWLWVLTIMGLLGWLLAFWLLFQKLVQTPTPTPTPKPTSTVLDTATYLNLCNQTSATTHAALAVNQGADKGWVSQGWYSLSPNQCKSVAIERKYAKNVYVYGEGSDNSLSGNYPICVGTNRQGQFTIQNSNKSCAGSDREKVKMKLIPVNAGGNLWNFLSDDSSSSGSAKRW